MNVKKIIKKLVFRHKCDSDTYIKYLKKKGLKIGGGAVFTAHYVQ